MSDDFIPLNQSTPVGGKWLGSNNQSKNSNYQNRNQNGPRRGNNRWGNNSHRNNSWGNNSQRNNSWSNNSHWNSSYGSDSNSSYGNEKGNIDAYLHPSMLQDPWAQLRRKLEDTK